MTKVSLALLLGLLRARPLEPLTAPELELELEPQLTPA